ncbi:NAD(P)/FAD-dependent oxidoreductase [Leekyejoonella antrihumi]|uniref:NAD(P)/FAD-dependent oxidoreductase n=1 Tax=Leekyejoonella antrihumi TaxID=1660198 RepID=A0A563E0R3_9MICO|nr:FAD-dependent oxidoreductase [Leekyejoonella antrihumi]TWP35484.1 NAD(P)/FAD-dependent oxidoreductase [Leekyejoonella antrihumi]
MHDITIVGASICGLYTARALRAEGFAGRITLVGDEVHRPYDRPPLSKEFLVGTYEIADIQLEDEDEHLDLNYRLGQPAVGLRAREQSVELADGSLVRGDAVVVATGARARTLPAAHGLEGVHTLRSLDDAIALRADLQPSHRLVVVGAGFIGAEIASSARGLGLEVDVVEVAPTPLAGPLGSRFGGILARLHERAGVRLHSGVAPATFEGDGRIRAVVLADGTRLPADVLVVGVGAAPNVEWLSGSPVAIGNGIETDQHGQTGLPGVFAVGDCAAWADSATGRPLRVEHWTNAVERPTVVAQQLLHGRTSMVPRPTYFWSDQYGVHVQFAGSIVDHDEVVVEDGDVDALRFLVTYRRAGEVIGVLGVDSVRQFTRRRRALSAIRTPA